MPTSHATSPGLTDLSGHIERVTFTNEENGYTVAKVKVKDRPDLVTVVGTLMNPTPGEYIKMQGEWSRHPEFGEQFKVQHYETTVPVTIYGIRKYLGSGMIRGIGPEMAKRIIRRFGKQTLDIITHHPEQLTEVAGIGPKRIEMIIKGWSDQREARDVMIFLQSHGVGTGYSARIFKQYGQAAIRVVKENPYRLAEDISGIGFTTADKIALKLGFNKNSAFRARAGIIYVLNRMADEGHAYCPYQLLLSKSGELLGVKDHIVADAITHVCSEKKIVIEAFDPEAPDSEKSPRRGVYLSHFYRCEAFVADKLAALDQMPASIRRSDADAALVQVQRRLAITLAPDQVTAVERALERRVLIITGGPGTGKTTIINVIVRICTRLGMKSLLAAPTGRAAKRMNEATGYTARTIHRLLEFSFQKGGFQRNEENPLDCHYLIIDEASMIDIILMYHLLKAVPMHTTLILVGDVHQLPSVGVGNVLGDIITAKCFAVAHLKEIFRQAATSRIIVNAHRINQGKIPHLSPTGGKTDFYFRKREDPEDALAFVVKLVVDHIPRVFGFDPVTDIQVLSPMHRGKAGTASLNCALQEALNPYGEGVRMGEMRLRVNDKVMQVKNNYDKEVFNGDIGQIHRIDPAAREVVINFEDRPIVYDFSDLGEVNLAYAISIHKSQGSEYPAVVIPLLTAHYILLQRNLIYTAVTRGKQLVVVVGSKKALAMAIKNDKTKNRYTRLKSRLIGQNSISFLMT
jgi:exodeoxyribonuclease V alpha subunit